jgi:predicted CXXCH cytochrome family protein
MRSIYRLSIAVTLALCGPALANAAPAAAAVAAPRQFKYPTSLKIDNKPLAHGEKAVVVHAPYGAGDCTICHQNNDPKNPGPVLKAGAALCYDCHAEFEEIMQRRYKHPPAQENCTSCHNPHDSKERKLLHMETASQCMACHKNIKQIVDTAKVKHGALTTGQKCANCHNPHGANIEKLLIQLPFDQCVNCHGTDDIKDWNAPVEAKDCSACHKTHGGDNFRLLVAEYPATFYSPYDPKNYSLCFGCHNDAVVKEPETTTLTNFRDGSKNLHFVHVNKADRGRTCRACHEVHASKQDHHIREGVPYGPKGWILKVNYTKTPTGGQCAKTCHETKTYVNKTLSTNANTNAKKK